MKTEIIFHNNLNEISYGEEGYKEINLFIELLTKRVNNDENLKRIIESNASIGLVIFFSMNEDEQKYFLSIIPDADIIAVSLEIEINDKWISIDRDSIILNIQGDIRFNA